ncbi:YebC/PmpR family DNA-binding transcriptional regulator [bacterium]|nr:YebC/PmpR family DNA-binding transcriptional regulator [bacterium]
MSGHNKWSSIKHKKAAADAKRGKAFSKISKEITIAAKDGGGDPNMNPRLRTAILAAKAVNMPQDNVTRAIKKGTGELPGVSYEEIIYEGYAPGGVGLIIEVLTDNRNRAAAEVRTTLDKRNGSLANNGAVAWQFNKKGVIRVPREKATEDDLFLLVSDAGAEDLTSDEENFEIICGISEFEAVKKALEDAKIDYIEANLAQIPASTVKVDDVKIAKQVLTLIDALDELDDVQNVYANFDMDDSVMEQASEE